MLYLRFQSGGNAYALAAREIQAVIPRVCLRPYPGAPACVAGLFNYRGTAVPVLDLSQLLGGTPGGARLSTRILLALYPRPAPARRRLVGLLAEAVTETVTRDDGDFAPTGLAGAPFLGPVACEGSQLLQRLQFAQLLSPELERQVFDAPAEKGA